MKYFVTFNLELKNNDGCFTLNTKVYNVNPLAFLVHSNLNNHSILLIDPSPKNLQQHEAPNGNSVIKIFNLEIIII